MYNTVWPQFLSLITSSLLYKLEQENSQQLLLLVNSGDLINLLFIFRQYKHGIKALKETPGTGGNKVKVVDTRHPYDKGDSLE